MGLLGQWHSPQSGGAGASVADAARIVVVEDETALREDLVEYLRHCGHFAVGAPSGAVLDELLGRSAFDLAILDVGLPGEDGFAIARRLRDRSGIGIVMLTARGQSVDRISGLEIGADAYMVKPVELRELEAQVRTLLRRVRASGSPEAAAPSAPGWVFEPVTWRLVSPSGAAVRLTAAERQFLALLTRHPAQPVSRAEVFRMLGKRQWEAGDRSVDSLVRRLRAKVERQTGEDLPVQSVHAIGYAFTAPVVMR